jgi:23S rRNA pseudouridine1911/1915/1917 synthase
MIDPRDSRDEDEDAAEVDESPLVEQARIVPASAAGERLDAWLGHALPSLSRVRWQALIRQGLARVDGEARKPNHRLAGGERVTWLEPEPVPSAIEAEAVALDVLHEDEDLLVLNKPAGMMVHPAPGIRTGTLVNALLHHCRDLSGIGGVQRPGIVHRLDRDTTGVMVVAKTQSALRKLKEQFHEREVRKQYVALVWGEPEPLCGRIETLVGRHPHDRKRMSARVLSGRRAVTHYATVERLGPATLVRLRIETGRTHQIRVHMAHIGHPVVGDAVYGRARKDPLPLAPARQMLHAERLAFAHPRTGEELEFEAPWPDDFRALIQALRATGA